MNVENLTERITIRFTESELKQLEQLAKKEHERKTSSFIRRILLAYLEKHSGNGGAGKVYRAA